jgi:flagellar biosynthesis protein FlhA
VTLDPQIEQMIMGSVKQTEQGAFISLDPAVTKSILKATEDEVKKLESKGDAPIVVTSPIVRMYFKKLTSDYLKDLIVISYNEIDSEVELKSVGVITIHDN